MKIEWIIAGLVLLWLLSRKPAPAPRAKPGAAGLQSVDVGNSISGAPVYNLSGTLAGRHLGVDNTSGVNLNPTTSTSSSSGSSGAATRQPTGSFSGSIQTSGGLGGLNTNASGGFNSQNFLNLQWLDFLASLGDAGGGGGGSGTIQNQYPD